MITCDRNIVAYTSLLMVRFSTKSSWISSGAVYTGSDIILNLIVDIDFERTLFK